MVTWRNALRGVLENHEGMNMRRQPPTDDRVIVAWYSEDGTPRTQVWDFLRLPLGSAWRCARVAEYERFKEALKGQGCELHVWHIHDWWRYRQAFNMRTL